LAWLYRLESGAQSAEDVILNCKVD
jgi:hypothetical protein